MQIPTFPKDPIDVPPYPEAWDEHTVGKLANMKPRRIRGDHADWRRGFLTGAAAAFLAFMAGIAVRDVIEVHWPAACDGIVTAGGCALRLVGAA